MLLLESRFFWFQVICFCVGNRTRLSPFVVLRSTWFWKENPNNGLTEADVRAECREGLSLYSFLVLWFLSSMWFVAIRRGGGIWRGCDTCHSGSKKMLYSNESRLCTFQYSINLMFLRKWWTKIDEKTAFWKTQRFGSLKFISQWLPFEDHKIVEPWIYVLLTKK